MERIGLFDSKRREIMGLCKKVSKKSSENHVMATSHPTTYYQLRIAVDVTNCFHLLNFSVNVILYSIINVKFRRTIKKLFFSRCCNSRSLTREAHSAAFTAAPLTATTVTATASSTINGCKHLTRRCDNARLRGDGDDAQRRNFGGLGSCLSCGCFGFSIRACVR
ncbi:hypothetical protein HELRODRAFT_165899 [Helobdella robusta]|uniref:Uncharacterized protein n=1 Tax=Helobdella robusta TaxID=6412 RepID=T1EXF1_HELRO|nr:hypothetical protein HELRODRAFT_165899 [Helobdella robusta]ESN91818.1 hypothetical protein HELRODRAFT_165899 [Helobdella robusta]